VGELGASTLLAKIQTLLLGVTIDWGDTVPVEGVMKGGGTDITVIN
jgi:hypothetical protein